MFFQILKRDLKRKKSMNILLFLFLILTAMLLGSSVTMISTVSSASSDFITNAKMADFVAIAYMDKNSDKVLEDWLSKNPIVKDYCIQDEVVLTKDMFTFKEGSKEFDFDNMIGIEEIPTNTNLVFDEEDQPMELKPGELAIPYQMRDMVDVKIGDTVTISAYGVTKELKVAHYSKDAFAGSSLLAYMRLITSKEDYEAFHIEKASKVGLVCANVTEGHKIEELEKEFSKLPINSIATITRALYKMLYLMEMLVAAVMAIVSVFLIIIAFVLLRFTITFTIQEDYKQIGIMKAIGLKDGAIQALYMVKYFVLSLIGGAVGYAISLPLGKCLVNVSCEPMVVKGAGTFNVVSLLLVAAIIGLTILFCRRCTAKIKKVSAMQAICNGSNGERFKKFSKLSLQTKKRMRTSTFLALTDIGNHFRKYAVLFLTFILGTMILLVPTNIINTLKDPSVVGLFGQPKMDVLINPKNATQILYTYTSDQVKDLMKEVNEEYKKEDIPVELFLDMCYMSKVYKDSKDDGKTIYTSVSYGIDSKEYVMEEGVAPELENEAAISTGIAEMFHVGVGDTLHIYVSDKERSFIVTGIYESMINMGKSIRLGTKLALPMNGCTSFNMFGRFTENGDQMAYREQMQKVDDRFEVKSAMSYVENMMGSVVPVLESMKYVVLGIILLINFLITVMIVRMMLAKEIAEVAILKSIGFKNRTIRGWQFKRMAFIVVISVIVGTVLVGFLGSNIALIVFKMMGVSSISLVVKPLQVFVLYPAIIMIDVMVAVFLSTFDIGKIKVWEINNQE